MKFKSGIRQHIAVFYALLLCFPIHIYLQMLVTKSQKTQMKCKRYELYSFFARKFRLHFWFGCVGCGMVNLVLYLKKFSTPILCVKVYGFIDFSLTSSLSLVYFCIALYGSVMWHTLGHIEKNWFFLNFTYLNHFIFFKLLVGYNDLNNFQLKRWSRVLGVQNYLNQFWFEVSVSFNEHAPYSPTNHVFFIEGKHTWTNVKLLLGAHGHGFLTIRFDTCIQRLQKKHGIVVRSNFAFKIFFVSQVCVWFVCM